MTRRAALLAPAVAGVSGALSVATLVLARVDGSSLAAFLDGNQANTWLAGLSSGIVAVLILHAQPRHRLGVVFAAASVCGAASAAGSEYARLAFDHHPRYPLAELANWVGAVFWMPAFLLVLSGVPLLFPDGAIPSPRWRWPARLALVLGVGATVLIATTDSIVQDSEPDAHNPFRTPIPDAVLVGPAIGCFLATVVIGVCAIVAIVVRMRHLGQPQRQQHAWFVAAVVLVLAVTWIPVPDAVNFAANGLSLVALGVGIVRYQLFDIELVLSRTLVYGVLTLGAMAAYLGAAALLGAGVGSGVGPALVAALAALGLAGLRGRLQRIVDRTLYGDRHDPFGALEALGHRLGNAVATDDVLPAVVETVRQTLRVPYVAVELVGDPGSGHPASSSGTVPEQVVPFPLVHAGETVGALVVGLRRGDTALSAADGRLLNAFAQQAAVAAHDARVTRDLRRSRERIVLGREEERRRLRRDLHDGLGPALAGISLGLETATRTAERHDARLAALLAQIHVDAAKATGDIRQIVADLRPPVLDAVGLVDAISQHADLLTSRSTGELRVTVTGPQLPDLPAAVEVAAYRIALEALTNTARHADATTCTVSVELNGSLYVTLEDDGRGLPTKPPGMGLSSMRDRAEELGGTCRITFVEGRGTTVHAVLPVEAP